MTKEEAYKLKLMDLGKRKIIDKIFDYFENRRCGSCEHYKIDKGNLRPFCNHYRMPTFEPDKDFYCKYWSAKDEDK